MAARRSATKASSCSQLANSHDSTGGACTPIASRIAIDVGVMSFGAAFAISSMKLWKNASDRRVNRAGDAILQPAAVDQDQRAPVAVRLDEEASMATFGNVRRTGVGIRPARGAWREPIPLSAAG